ncbi:MAG: ABC transporter substrate-binding protein [Ardenticatenales bacterium]|nr:ABC transporter substrate-binding protein [Ardenticatenales bacterium]
MKPNSIKVLFYLLLLTVIGGLLISCGNQAPSVEEQSPQTTEATDEVVELRLWTHSNSSFVAANEELIQRFEAEHPNVKIKLETFDYDIFIQTLQTSMPAGTEADIIEMFGSWVCTYADGGRLAPMPEQVATLAEAQNAFFAAPLEGYHCGDQLYGLPHEFNIEYGGVLVNPALFEAAGVAYPPTWGEDKDQFVADAAKLSQFESDTMTATGFHFINGDGLPFLLLAGILQEGGEYWKPDGSGLQLNTPEAQKTLTWMKSLVSEHKVIDPFLFNQENNSVVEAFFSNRAAVALVGPWAAATGKTDFPEIEFDYVAMPHMGSTPAFVADSGWGKVVSVNSKHQELAWEFVKFVTMNQEHARTWNIKTATVPALQSIAEDPTLPEELPWIQAVLPILPHGRYVGPLPDRNLFWGEIAYPHILAVLQDQETVEDALIAMEEEVNETFEAR